jgi:hypothetical protein
VQDEQIVLRADMSRSGVSALRWYDDPNLPVCAMPLPAIPQITVKVAADDRQTPVPKPISRGKAAPAREMT